MGWFWNKSQDAASPNVRTDNTASEVETNSDATPRSWWQRLREGLKRTSDLLRTDIRDLLARRDGQLVDHLLDDLYIILLRTDMGPAAAREACNRIAEQYRGRLVHLDELLASVKATFLERLRREAVELRMAASGPTVILVVGVNGSGKTTSIAKLAYMLQKRGLTVVLGAGDTFRAAAVEQLKVWAERLAVPIVTGASGSDPASVAHRAVSQAIQTNANVCIIDTAGRLQTQVNLMEQLKKIRRVIQKQLPEAPHEVLLVLDATAGQNGISQAKGFSDAAGCTGIILAKLDGTAKGGVILPIQERFKIPVKFVGVGEKLEDLVEFDPVQFVEGLFN